MACSAYLYAGEAIMFATVPFYFFFNKKKIMGLFAFDIAILINLSHAQLSSYISYNHVCY